MSAAAGLGGPAREVLQDAWVCLCALINHQITKKTTPKEIADGEIALVPEPAEERRVRTRHGSPRGVCAAAAYEVS